MWFSDVWLVEIPWCTGFFVLAGFNSTYCMYKTKWPILCSNWLYKISHYFLDRQYMFTLYITQYEKWRNISLGFPPILPLNNLTVYMNLFIHPSRAVKCEIFMRKCVLIKKAVSHLHKETFFAQNTWFSFKLVYLYEQFG